MVTERRSSGDQDFTRYCMSAESSVCLPEVTKNSCQAVDLQSIGCELDFRSCIALLVRRLSMGG